jgi:hypothetical protein
MREGNWVLMTFNEKYGLFIYVHLLVGWTGFGIIA